MSALTEKDIVNAVRQGQREGQTEMVSRYAQRIYALIVREVTDPMDAQELTQDAFMRAFSHIDSYDPQKASLSAWQVRVSIFYTKRWSGARAQEAKSTISGRQTLTAGPLSLIIKTATGEGCEDAQVSTDAPGGRQGRPALSCVQRTARLFRLYGAYWVHLCLFRGGVCPAGADFPVLEVLRCYRSIH